MADLLRKNELEEARSHDVDYFQNTIKTTQRDQILKVFKSSAVWVGEMFMNIHKSETWCAKNSVFAGDYCIGSGILVVERLLAVSHCQFQRIRTIRNDSNRDPERQFLDRGLRAMKAIKSIPPQDAFSMSEFDIVVYRDRELGSGGFGEVFEGNWFGTKVAIKRIRNFHPAVSRTMDFFDRYSDIPSFVKMRSRS